MNRWWPVFLAFFLLVILFGGVTTALTSASSSAVSYTEFKALVMDREITSALLDEHAIRATHIQPDDTERVVVVARVSGDETLIPFLETHGVEVSGVPRNACSDGQLGLFILPFLILVGFWWVMMRQGGPPRGVAAFGKNNATLAPEEGTGVSFDDIAGVDEAAEELQEVIAFLTTPERFTSLGGRPPKGVLLVGPPGTGKTLLARAVAGEADVPFFSISGSSFVEMFVGVGAARVRDLFKTAEEHAPCIIFIDELDAVGKARGLSGPAGNEEREQTLNQLLVELDGFDNRNGIIVMGATNRPETLDRALLRAGRFDRQVLVDRPDVRGREAILKVHAAKLKLDDGVSLKDIAGVTPGFAGADLANILNDAALLAARRERTAIAMKDIQDAIERTVAGLEKKNRRLSEKERKVVAYHECGHAICAAASPGADPVKKISIIPRGIAALGYTIQMPLEDRYLMSKSELFNRITVLYGGRVAEEIVFGDITTGAHDDIRKASDLARRMVTEYGMSRAVGAINYSGETAQNPFGLGPSQNTTIATSPKTAEIIEREIRRVTELCHERARQILLENRDLLEEMSLSLLKHEVLDGEPMTALLARAQPARPWPSTENPTPVSSEE